jgi:hypothetical protein
MDKGFLDFPKKNLLCKGGRLQDETENSCKTNPLHFKGGHLRDEASPY